MQSFFISGCTLAVMEVKLKCQSLGLFIKMYLIKVLKISCTGSQSGSVNRISLAEECLVKGQVIRQIGHSIGVLITENNRPDRDLYIEILWRNIRKGTKFYHFNKYISIKGSYKNR